MKKSHIHLKSPGIRHSRSFWDRVGYDHLVILLAVPR
jgi:hypothetical protein